MRLHVRRRFWLELATATLSGALLLLTLLWRDWIERVFGVDPDQHSGSLEWIIVAAALMVTVSCSVVARSEWRRRFSTTADGEALG
jgi:hypothetical protein